MEDSKPSRSDQDRVFYALRVVVFLVVPLASIVGAYYSTKAALEGDLSALRQRVEYNERDSRGQLERVYDRLKLLDSAFDTHRSLGPDGLPHPQGVIRALEELREDFNAAQKGRRDK